MVVLYLKPSEIYFNQEFISNYLKEDLPDIMKNWLAKHWITSGKCKITDLPPIKETKRGCLCVTGNSRWLWISTQFQMLGESNIIVAEYTRFIDSIKTNYFILH